MKKGKIKDENSKVKVVKKPADSKRKKKNQYIFYQIIISDELINIILPNFISSIFSSS